jgi:amino acid transporter
VLSLGFSSFGWVSVLVSVTIFGVAARQIALMSIYFAGNTRLPMVAGWDNLLPAWFAKLHQRYRTPVNSILFVGVVTLAFSLLPLIGVLEEEAFQIQDNAATMFYALIYIVLFAIPFVALSRFGVKAPLWLKIASAAGLVVSVIAGFYAMFPIKPVAQPWAFALKVFAVVALANIVGVLLYSLRGRGRRAAVA